METTPAEPNSNQPVPTVLTANAKLTVNLRMVGTRADGYHLIDAEMVSLDLADRITVSETDATSETDGPSDGAELSVTGPFSDGVPTDHTNLVARALRLVDRNARVSIDKQIPHGGGLGGGSTDAAAIFRWAGMRDLAAASQIGADIPFCIIGGRARVTGIGEIVEPMPHQDQAFTLIIPPLHVSTPEVYRAFDELGPDAVASAGPNHLEPAAIEVEPELATWRDRIMALSGQIPVLAGSGATWFVFGKHGNALAALNNEGARVLEAVAVPGLDPTSL